MSKSPYLRAHLKRNLRKSILQGNPWIYKEAVEFSPRPSATGLCEVFDNKKKFVCWAIYCHDSPLALRVLSLQRKDPVPSLYRERLIRAIALRSHLASQQTTAYRLINGEGDFLPGLVCDVYGSVAVLQCDGQGPFEFWNLQEISDWLLEQPFLKTVYFKPRSTSGLSPQVFGEPLADELLQVQENAVNFYVDIVEGQKTGFFLDQRDNRNYLKGISSDKEVANLFSYSGGFSVYAGMGGAKKVVSVDIAQGALDLAEKNFALNDLGADTHSTLCVDVFDYITSATDGYDIVICDPPSLAKSEKHREAATQKYTETFAAAAKMVRSGGHLMLSSCSSHISFSDFNEIMVASLSKARRTGQVLRVSGQGMDHPYPHACPHLRYLKFIDVILN